MSKSRTPLKRDILFFQTYNYADILQSIHVLAIGTMYDWLETIGYMPKGGARISFYFLCWCCFFLFAFEHVILFRAGIRSASSKLRVQWPVVRLKVEF